MGLRYQTPTRGVVLGMVGLGVLLAASSGACGLSLDPTSANPTTDADVDTSSSGAPISSSSSGESSTSSSSSGSSVTSSSSSSGSSGLPQPGQCDTAPNSPHLQDPIDECIDQAYGVFVKRDANDNGDGSPAHPLQSINDAVNLIKTTAGNAAERKFFVFVCDGNYEDRLVIDDLDVSIIGSFDECEAAPWKRVSALNPNGGRTQVGTNSTLGAEVKGESTVYFSHLGFEPKAGIEGENNSNERNSIALLISGKSMVFAHNSYFHAGFGAPGRAPAAPPNPRADGSPASEMGPGGECQDNAGNRGGAGAPNTMDNGSNGLPVGRGGVGGVVGETCATGSVGKPGTDGAIAAQANENSEQLGTLSNTGWSPSHGLRGPNGAHGGGGGGGAFPMSELEAEGVTTGHGGGGGCLGAGSDGGQSGGSSIAVAVVGNSEFISTQSTLKVDGGGNGGVGRAGQTGGRGGLPSTGQCGGGAGGAGSGGAGGNGGNGGVAIGLLRDSSSTVRWDNSSALTATALPGMTLGAGGGAGTGGVGGLNPATETASPTGRDGRAGVSHGIATSPVQAPAL